jgi:hypothetical protein
VAAATLQWIEATMRWHVLKAMGDRRLFSSRHFNHVPVIVRQRSPDSRPLIIECLNTD